MENQIIYQKLKQNVVDEYQQGEKYYAILSVINALALTKRDVQLAAFTAVKGSISEIKLKNEFCKKHKTSLPTVNNLISRLKKKNILVKNKDGIIVNPVISLDFKKPLRLEINLQNGETK